MYGRPAWRAAPLTAVSLAGGLLAGVTPASAAMEPAPINTVAGGPGRGLATNVFQQPGAVAAGPDGAVYVADGYVVRELGPTGTWEGVTAGTGVPGFSGDAGNDRVRVVAARTGEFYRTAMTAGHIYTVAGNGTAGFSGDCGPASRAELSGPQGVAADQAGDLIIGDAGNGRVRLVRP
jgi:NHL repeat-containing protein